MHDGSQPDEQQSKLLSCLQLRTLQQGRLCQQQDVDVRYTEAHLVVCARQPCQEVGGHCRQCIARPSSEPVQRGAVDKGWELAQPLTEGVANRAEAQHNVQVAAHLGETEPGGSDAAQHARNMLAKDKSTRY